MGAARAAAEQPDLDRREFGDEQVDRRAQRLGLRRMRADVRPGLRESVHHVVATLVATLGAGQCQ